MSDRFIKLQTDFSIGFLDRLDAILAEFDGERVDPNPISSTIHAVYLDGDILHWQYYPISRVRISRNFCKNYREECESVAESLRALQTNLRTTYKSGNKLMDLFLQHEIAAKHVTLMIQPAGQSAVPHCDTRRAAINIGLRNSSTARTWVSNTDQENDFDTLDLEFYVMNDYDIYLLNTKYSHTVESLVTVDDSRDRYILSYCIP